MLKHGAGLQDSNNSAVQVIILIIRKSEKLYTVVDVAQPLYKEGLPSKRSSRLSHPLTISLFKRRTG